MHKVAPIFEGWSGYQTSSLHAVTSLTTEQLSWRPAPDRGSVGERSRHISLGRISWFSRIGAPAIDAIAQRVPRWCTDNDGSRHPVEESVPCVQAAVLAEWLTLSWQPIQRLLDEWSTEDLFVTCPHRFQGVDYDISCQWTVWRMISHETHHGGQLAMMLAVRGIQAFELRGLGGHIITRPIAKGSD
jgi:uncharacterized damage-inducible protein DinB